MKITTLEVVTTVKLELTESDIKDITVMLSGLNNIIENNSLSDAQYIALENTIKMLENLTHQLKP